MTNGGAPTDPDDTSGSVATATSSVGAAGRAATAPAVRRVERPGAACGATAVRRAPPPPPFSAPPVLGTAAVGSAGVAGRVRPPPPPAYGGYRAARTSGLAIASMVLGIVWVFWLGSILAVIFGHVALSQIKRSMGALTGARDGHRRSGPRIPRHRPPHRHHRGGGDRRSHYRDRGRVRARPARSLSSEEQAYYEDDGHYTDVRGLEEAGYRAHDSDLHSVAPRAVTRRTRGPTPSSTKTAATERSNMQDVRDKVAVITGGASGMGRAFADRFGAEGMKLVLADIEEPELARSVDELKAAGAEVIGVRTDVARIEDVQALRERAREAFGAVHVVCNNAGVAGGSVIDSPIEMWQWVLGVNLWGVIHGCNVFLPDLLEQDEGHIVNTASIAGLGGAAGLGVYCTSKFAVVGLSESLHHDLAARSSHVGVSVLCPGFVNTRIFESDRNMPDEVRAVLDTPRSRSTRSSARWSGSGSRPRTRPTRCSRRSPTTGSSCFRTNAPRVRSVENRLVWMQGGEPAAFDIESLIRP